MPEPQTENPVVKPSKLQVELGKIVSQEKMSGFASAAQTHLESESLNTIGSAVDTLMGYESQRVAENQPDFIGAFSKVFADRAAEDQKIRSANAEKRAANSKLRELSTAQNDLVKVVSRQSLITPPANQDFGEHINGASQLIGAEVSLTQTVVAEADQKIIDAKKKWKESSLRKADAAETAKFKTRNEANANFYSLLEISNSIDGHSEDAELFAQAEYALASEVVDLANSGDVGAIIDAYGGEKGKSQRLDEAKHTKLNKDARAVSRGLQEFGFQTMGTEFASASAEQLSGEDRRVKDHVADLRGLVQIEFGRAVEQGRVPESTNETVSKLVESVPTHALNSGVLTTWEQAQHEQYTDKLRQIAFDAIPRHDISTDIGCNITPGGTPDERTVDVRGFTNTDNAANTIYGKIATADLTTKVAMDYLRHPATTRYLKEGDYATVARVKAAVEILNSAAEDRQSAIGLAEARVRTVNNRLAMTENVTTGVKIAESGVIAAAIVFGGKEIAHLVGVNADSLHAAIEAAPQQLAQAWQTIGSSGSNLQAAGEALNTSAASQAVDQAQAALGQINALTSLITNGPAREAAMRTAQTIVEYAAPALAAVSAGLSMSERFRSFITRNKKDKE